MAMLLCSVQFEFCGRFFSAGILVLGRELVSRTIAVTKINSEFKNGMTQSQMIDAGRMEKREEDAVTIMEISWDYNVVEDVQVIELVDLVHRSQHVSN